jgi:hypothetical protein
MIRFEKDEINKKYSKTWVLCNDNAQSKLWRSKFTEKYGGSFVREGRNGYFKWEEPKFVPRKRKYVFEDKNGVVYIVENILEFCRVNDLLRAKMYEVISGTRKQYKGYKYITTIEAKGLKI